MSKSDSKDDVKDSYSSNGAKNSFDVAESKHEEDIYEDGSKDTAPDMLPPKLWVQSLKFNPDSICPISSPLELQIDFELERDVVAGYWIVKFLVDSAENRIIKILGEEKDASRLHSQPDPVSLRSRPPHQVLLLHQLVVCCG